MVHRESFRVRFYESDPGGRAAVPALCRYLQEAADSHCLSHGVSLSELLAAGRTWVLTRLALRFDTLPRRGDEVVVETWGSSRLGGVRAYRDFRVLDHTGKTLGKASSVWLMLDRATRRPVRLPETVLRFRNPDRPPDEEFDRLRLSMPERIDTEERFRVRWRDLDANGHANNVCYIEWAIETVPLELRRDGRLTALDAEFRGEALLDQEVVCTAERNGNAFRHSIGIAGGSVLAVLKTEWNG